MLEALTHIEATQETQAARSFWWTALAFIEALRDPAVSADGSVRQVSARIDQQIRRLLEGSNSLAERLMREALYHVAQASADAGGVVSQVQASFGLPSQLPNPEATISVQPQDAVLRRLREVLTSIEEQWNRLCSSGSVAALPAFAEQVRGMAAMTEEIGQTDLKRLGQGMAGHRQLADRRCLAFLRQRGHGSGYCHPAAAERPGKLQASRYGFRTTG